MPDTTTPPEVADQASIRDALPLDQAALIGIFHAPDADAALVRTAEGEILRLVRGNRLGRATVTRISDTGIELEEAGHTVSLSLPAEPPPRPTLRPRSREEADVTFASAPPRHTQRPRARSEA